MSLVRNNLVSVVHVYCHLRSGPLPSSVPPHTSGVRTGRTDLHRETEKLRPSLDPIRTALKGQKFLFDLFLLDVHGRPSCNIQRASSGLRLHRHPTVTRRPTKFQKKPSTHLCSPIEVHKTENTHTKESPTPLTSVFRLVVKSCLLGSSQILEAQRPTEIRFVSFRQAPPRLQSHPKQNQ